VPKDAAMRPIDWTTWPRTVQQLGFPVVVAGALLWSMLVGQPQQIGAVLEHLDGIEKRQALREDAVERRQALRDEQERQRTEAIVHLVGRLEAVLAAPGHGAGR